MTGAVVEVGPGVAVAPAAGVALGPTRGDPLGAGEPMVSSEAVGVGVPAVEPLGGGVAVSFETTVTLTEARLVALPVPLKAVTVWTAGRAVAGTVRLRRKVPLPRAR
jgi:hypothetical protein